MTAHMTHHNEIIPVQDTLAQCRARDCLWKWHKISDSAANGEEGCRGVSIIGLKVATGAIRPKRKKKKKISQPEI